MGQDEMRLDLVAMRLGQRARETDSDVGIASQLIKWSVSSFGAFWDGAGMSVTLALAMT